MARGLYVRATIRAPLDRAWELTQTPALHERWDLCLSSIQHLSRPASVIPQPFTYATRLGLGLVIAGTGTSGVMREAEGGVRTCTLRFRSSSALSLLEEGSDLWEYVPQAGDESLHFSTWSDYRTRWGLPGRVADVFFRPLLGWATAWSFDRLRLWAEADIAPEVVRTCTLIYSLARLGVVFVWLWHGLVPKLLFQHRDELQMLHDAGVSARVLPWFGGAEVAFGVVGLLLWRWRGYLGLTAALMLLALAGVALRSPEYLTAAFNPVTLNVSVFALSVVGWWAWRYTAFASRCLRRPPTRRGETR